MTVRVTAERIKALQIQGATNVAIESVKALSKEMRTFEWNNTKQIRDHLESSIATLTSSRPTEPMMRNGLNFIKRKIDDSDWTDKSEFNLIVKHSENQILKMFDDAMEKMVEVGAKRIQSGDTILTHCHSSAVTSTFLRAKKQGKEFKVIQTESRPKYQGRITAHELTEAGINTFMIVDSAARHYIKKVDIVFLGSDAITSEGNVINKIGSSMIALVAWESRIPFYIVSSLLKFDPVTIYGTYETIEERDTTEIWDNPPSGLQIFNPAFDVTRRDYIHGLITEEGIISPHIILEAIHRHYPWLL